MAKRISKSDFKQGLATLLEHIGEIRRCLEHLREETSFEAKIYDLSAKAASSIKETLMFVDFM